jgi:hypothetical protein
MDSYSSNILKPFQYSLLIDNLNYYYLIPNVINLPEERPQPTKSNTTNAIFYESNFSA